MRLLWEEKAWEDYAEFGIVQKVSDKTIEEGERSLIKLEKINGKNVWDILKLCVSEEQKIFVE